MNEPMTATARAAHRYAAYYAPAMGSAWWEFGSGWLGRCAATGEPRTQPKIPGVPPELQRALTAAPRRYGWHATLKAPFALAPAVSAATLRDGIGALCHAWDAFDLPTLEVTMLDDFLALVPSTPSVLLDTVAGACVIGLHTFAAPLSAADLARRRAAELSVEEDALLVRWGYPFVLQKFRFHMSLTGSLRGVPPEVVAALRNGAQQAVEKLPPCRFDAISLFSEPAPGSDFLCKTQTALGT
ncbi:hypothetical protein AX767_06180 [Variovorax sp. PAMC 28711]|nr:hypothetical protein AX767_06180 [Variovorax sp. PAMC 28711]